jgi:phosphatidylserine/phosphatidylglycerophosphate/cardiolipin synthase-like enzyme
MKRPFSLLVALTMISIAMVAGPPNARAADPALTTAAAKPKPKAVFTPAAGAIFNKPRGTKAQQLVIMNLLVRSTRSAPRGSTIRIAVYSFSYTPLATALMKAFRRGVTVKIIIDDHAIPRTVENLRLRKELNTNLTDESWVRTCTFGCMSAKPSIMHAKLYQFSRSGTANNVTMISSANPAFVSATSSWNNNYTMIGDVTTYESNKKYFDDMARDQTNTAYYRVTTSGAVQTHFFPRAGKTSKSDNVYATLASVKCRGAGAGYGNADRRTIVRISTWEWTALRADIARKLAELAGKGCDIQVIYSRDRVQAPVPATLLRKKVPTYDSRVDLNGDLAPDLYAHSKYLLINGVLGSDTRAKVVYTGSANLTRNSLRESNEIMIRIDRDDIYNQYVANFNEIRNGWTKRVTKVPVPRTDVDAKPLDENNPRANDYRLDPDEDD